jgi:hypothetical protein
MAATTYAGGNHTTTAGSKTVTATPAVGDLIVIVGASSGLASALDITPTDNNADGNGAYTRVALAQSNANTELEAIYIRNALIGSATSTVFTLGLSASNSGGGLTVYRISGMTKTGLTAMLQKIEQSNGASGSAPSVTFPSAANTSNVIIDRQRDHPADELHRGRRANLHHAEPRAGGHPSRQRRDGNDDHLGNHDARLGGNRG